MRRPRLLLALASCALALASAGCRTPSGGISFVPTVGAREVVAPPTVAAQVGHGRLPVHGASLYAPGQEIYKELRQQESLMAFLACQGEPDFVEVVAHPGAPKIYLYYTRRGLSQTGTVEIYPSDAGFYAARPIDPKLRGPAPPPKRAPNPPPPRPTPSVKPKPPAPEPAPEPEPPPEVEPAPEPETEPAPEPEPRWPEPSAQQRDDCPIEPWRKDCRELCVEGAPWEWCDYHE